MPRSTTGKAKPVPPPEAPPMSEEPVDGAALLQAIADTFGRFMWMQEQHRITCALWVLHTYAAEASFFTPYLHIYSPVRECGKSTLLTILEALARRPVKADAMTPAAMYRLIERRAPSLLLDELDTLLKSKESGERVRGVLNSGFRRDGRVYLCEGDAHDVKEFPTYCPKALAGIGQLWDTVESRSIPIQLDRATAEQRKDLAVVRGDRIHEELQELRLDAARWTHDHHEPLAEADPVVPPGLGARAADIWRPLLAIAEAAGGDWPALARCAAVMLSAPRPETDWGVMLLEDIALVIQEDPSRIIADLLASATLLECLQAREDRPWPTFAPGGRPITGHGLASLFRRFGIRPTVRRPPGRGVTRGYAWSEIAAAIVRYTSVQRDSLPSVTDVTLFEGVAA